MPGVLSGRESKVVMGEKIRENISQAPQSETKADIIINGKSEGSKIFLHILMPFMAPVNEA